MKTLFIIAAQNKKQSIIKKKTCYFTIDYAAASFIR